MKITNVRANSSSRGAPARLRLPGVGQIAAHGVLVSVAIADLLPFVWMVLGSFKTYVDLTNNPGWPAPWTWANYDEILSRTNFVQAFLNSVIVVLPRVLFGGLTSAAMGYVFAKYRFPGRDLLFTVLISTMMVPFVVILVPLYVTLADLGLVNNLYGLIIFGAYNTFGVFLLRQSILGIPNELIDAARIDGANEAWVFSRVIIPLSGAPLAALTVVIFLASWDDYMFPSVVLTDPAVKTIPLFIAGLRTLYWSRYELFATGAMLTVVPVMLLYAMLQKHFVRGITLTGLRY